MKELLQFYVMLYEQHIMKNRQTLFGQVIMRAYESYMKDKNPVLLAEMLGLEPSKPMPQQAIRKAYNNFVLSDDSLKPIIDENGQPVLDANGQPTFEVHRAGQGEPFFMNQLRKDYAVESQSA